MVLKKVFEKPVKSLSFSGWTSRNLLTEIDVRILWKSLQEQFSGKKRWLRPGVN